MPDRWTELTPLLDAALELDPSERPAFLDRSCAGDAELRAELETLVAECARSDRLLESGAVERFAALLASAPRALPEIMAGRYRIVREIGAGGMATVYLARDIKHDRDVALKVIRDDLSAVIGGERFLAEVRIAARLDHPHILTLIDSGSAGGVLFYVLPYVRGESLREKIRREKQCSLDEALSITRQVASALDHAHAHGVVHRDIKPENILLHEGEAMLADFGIALAMTEAGGDRLTQTGISLGTPLYMSPEQATGDRTLDARSDIYSLAAVLYEMIAGEPPLTGATAQGIVAKLLTERPTRLRVVRDTVPDTVDRAVDKALSKVPADRFATAGAFARALESGVALPTETSARRSKVTIFAAFAVVAALALAVFARGKAGGARAGITLRDRRQITFTGDAVIPAISGDGSTLASRTTTCGPNGCTFGIRLQDVGGAASRTLFDGASAIYQIEWSPDRRNLLFRGTFGGVSGMYLVSALGGTPTRVTQRATFATFFAGGDSLLSRKGRSDFTKGDWIMVSGLDGVDRDSIHVCEPGDVLAFFGAVPGSKWIAVGLFTRRLLESRVISLEWRLVGRDGRVASSMMVGDVGGDADPRMSSDALWVSPGGGVWPRRSVFRTSLDAASGRLSSSMDTIETGVYSGFSVTADGRGLVLDEGSTEFNLWGVDVRDAVRGVFLGQKRLLRSTSALNVQLSPDGQQVLVGRDVGKAGDGLQGWTTIPFSGGAEKPLALVEKTRNAIWSDSATVAIRIRTPAGSRFALVDLETGAVRERFEVPDRVTNTYAHLPAGGWTWVRGFRPEVSLQLTGDSSPRRTPFPTWYAHSFSLDVSRDGRFVGVVGVKAPPKDSLRVSVLSRTDGTVTPWFTTVGEGGDVSRLKDGTFLLRLRDTPETFSLYHLLGPGRTEKVGAIPRMVSSLSVSEDLKRAAVVVRDYHGDAWMSRVVRP